jgi:hypothetical protein
VARIVGSESGACNAERLAWAASGPKLKAIGPSSDSAGFFPSTDSGEQMNSAVSIKIGSGQVVNIGAHGVALDDASFCKVPEPLRCIGVVVG